MLGKHVISPFSSIYYIFSVNYLFLMNITYVFAIITCLWFLVLVRGVVGMTMIPHGLVSIPAYLYGVEVSVPHVKLFDAESLAEMSGLIDCS